MLEGLGGEAFEGRQWIGTASVKTTGRPPEHSLKPGNHQPRTNAVKTKKAYKCSICGKTGHTAGSRCPDKCLDCPAGIKNHKKGNCPTGKTEKREREDPEAEERIVKKKTQPGDGSTASTSISSRGRRLFGSVSGILTF